MATLANISYENNMYRIAVNSEGKYFPQVNYGDGWSCFRQWISYEKGTKNRSYKTERSAFKFLVDMAAERMDTIQHADVTSAEWHGDNWTRAYEAVKTAQEAFATDYTAKYIK